MLLCFSIKKKTHLLARLEKPGEQQRHKHTYAKTTQRCRFIHCCPTSLAGWGTHNNESGQAASERHSCGQFTVVDELPHSITTALLCNRFCRQRQTQIQIRSTHSHAYKCLLLYFATQARKVISACTYHFQQTNQNLFPFPAWINQLWFSSKKI